MEHKLIDDIRPYKLKKSVLDFLCPLCGVERQLSTSHRIEKRHILPILVAGLFLFSLLYLWISWSALVAFPLSFLTFEFARRSIYRKEIVCPHCGFDAVWYRKDVTVAKKLVHEFWENKKNKF